jgi:hypothetical protein
MAQATIMSWNLGAMDPARANRAPGAIVNYLATVIEAGPVALAAFSGIRGELAGGLGTVLTEELENRSIPPVEWNSAISPTLGAGRDEQYLFVWNRSVVTAQPCPKTDTFLQWEYAVPGGQDQYYGFPRDPSQAPDLPPVRMLFQPVGSDRLVSIAIINGPDWMLGNQAGVAAHEVCGNLAQIPELDQGHGGLLMGTFNVPLNDDVNTAKSNGAAVFAPLLAKYQQTFHGSPTALAGVPKVAIPMEEAQPQTADAIFFRRNGAQNGLGYSRADVPDLLGQALGTLDDQGNWVSAPMGMPLALVEYAMVGGNAVAAEPDGSYVKLEDAFIVYRELVSAYLPALITLTY